MYWFARPPYLRWLGAALLLVVGLWIELRPVETVEVWFTNTDVAEGVPLDPTVVEARRVPAGVLVPAPPEGVAATGLPAGTPLTAAVIDTSGVEIPADWWTIALDLPSGTTPGTAVLLIMLGDDGSTRSAEGVVVAGPAPTTGPLGLDDRSGVVAIPGQIAAEVAQAESTGRLTVLAGR